MVPMSQQFEFSFPDGFVIVIDTREQTPLFLPKPPKGLVIVRDTLKYGDMSVKGFEPVISVERKNLDDLWSSLTVNAERFRKELEELSKYERKWILVEGTECEALRPDEGGRDIHPNAIRQGMASIEGRLGIPFHYSASKESAERFVLDVFIKIFKWKRGL